MIYSELLARKDSFVCALSLKKKNAQNANSITALLCFLSLFSCCLSGSSADSAARPHTVGSGQAPRGMMSSLQIELKALEMRKGHNMLPLEPRQLELERCNCKNPEWWSRLLQENVSRVLFALFSARVTSCLS